MFFHKKKIITFDIFTKRDGHCLFIHSKYMLTSNNYCEYSDSIISPYTLPTVPDYKNKDVLVFRRVFKTIINQNMVFFFKRYGR